MLKKLFFLSFTLVPLFVFSEPSSVQNEILKIDQEIQTLQERWRQINLKQMKEDVGSQGLMIADWEKYAEEVEQIREGEIEDDRIEKRINQLKAKKAQLLKQNQ